MIVTQVFIAVAVSLFAATAQNPVDSPVTSGKENYEKMSSFDVPAAQNVNVREVADYDDDYYDEDADITKRDNEKQLKNTNVDNKAGNQARTDLERERRTGDTEAAENTNDTEGPITEEDIMAELGKLLSAKRSVDADEDEDYDDDDYVSRQKRDVDESYDENLDFDDVDDDLSMYKRDADDIDDDEEDEDDDDDEDDYEDDDVTKRKRGLDYDDDDDDDDDDYVTRKRRQDDDGDDDDDEEDDDVDEDDDEEVDDDDEDYDDYDYDEEIGKRDLGKEERKADSSSDSLSHLVGDPVQPAGLSASPLSNNSAAPVVPPAPQPRPARDLEEGLSKDTAQREVEGNMTIATTSIPNMSSQSLMSTSEPPLSSHSVPLTDHTVVPTTPVVEHMHFHDDVDFSILETGENIPKKGVVVNGKDETVSDDDGKINDEGTDLTKKSLKTVKKYQVPHFIAKHMNPYQRAMLPVALWKKSYGQRLSSLDKSLLQKFVKFKGSSSVQLPHPSPGIGPIATKYKLQRKFGRGFTKNPKVDVQWHEPQMMANCWVQSMLSGRYGFSPNCNEDGTFGPKQCFLQRCWCVNKDGSPQERDDGGRFRYAINGVTLKCTQHYR